LGGLLKAGAAVGTAAALSDVNSKQNISYAGGISGLTPTHAGYAAHRQNFGEVLGEMAQQLAGAYAAKKIGDRADKKISDADKAKADAADRIVQRDLQRQRLLETPEQAKSRENRYSSVGPGGLASQINPPTGYNAPQLTVEDATTPNEPMAALPPTPGYTVNNTSAPLNAALRGTPGTIAPSANQYAPQIPQYQPQLSDEKSKNKTHEGSAQEMWGKINPYEYEYKPQMGEEPGKRLGPMAQEIAASGPDGARAVLRDPNSGLLKVDYLKLLPSMTAGLADVNKRLEQIEKKKGKK
jgi:hypothetical protein